MLILSWALGLAVVLHVYFHVQSLQEFKEAHNHPFVLVGDSHADDVPWKDKPRFSGPAQDLFSSLKMVESLAATKDDRSDIQGIVFTFWPNKFSPLAEDRLSGNTQEDNWGQMAMGRVAPLMTWTDLWRSDVPLKFRLSMAWHTLQCKKTHAWWDVACEEQAVSEGYREGLGERMTSNNWWAEASVAPDLFRGFGGIGRGGRLAPCGGRKPAASLLLRASQPRGAAGLRSHDGGSRSPSVGAGASVGHGARQPKP